MTASTTINARPPFATRAVAALSSITFVLHLVVNKDKDGRESATVKTVLAPIARPVDLHLSGKGKMYICEYSRQIDNGGFNGMLPGRVLELAAK